MTAKIEEQREFFFKQVSEGEDMEAIRARGEAFDRQPDQADLGASIKIDRVELTAGQKYRSSMMGPIIGASAPSSSC